MPTIHATSASFSVVFQLVATCTRATAAAPRKRWEGRPVPRSRDTHAMGVQSIWVLRLLPRSRDGSATCCRSPLAARFPSYGFATYPWYNPM